MNNQEFKSVSNLPVEKRYQYFMKRVADWELIYTLEYEDGNLAESILDDRVMIPFWSSEEFAESCKVNGWENCKVRKIMLNDFEESIVNTIDSNNYLINVFPIQDKTGFVVDLSEFIRDLNDELDRF